MTDGARAGAADASGGDIWGKWKVAAVCLMLSGCGFGSTVGSVVGGTVGGAVDLVVRADGAPSDLEPAR